MNKVICDSKINNQICSSPMMSNNCLPRNSFIANCNNLITIWKIFFSMYKTSERNNTKLFFLRLFGRVLALQSNLTS